MTDAERLDAERVVFAARALRLEMDLRAAQVERDYWRDLVLKRRAQARESMARCREREARP